MSLNLAKIDHSFKKKVTVCHQIYRNKKTKKQEHPIGNENVDSYFSIPNMN
jgi:hypothetical protein